MQYNQWVRSPINTGTHSEIVSGATSQDTACIHNQRILAFLCSSSTQYQYSSPSSKVTNTVPFVESTFVTVPLYHAARLV